MAFRLAVCCHRSVDYELTRGVRVVGWLHVATGATMLVALSGAAVTSGRLWFDGPGQGVIAALITNLIVLAALFSARRGRGTPGG